ncbi:MAG: twin-arginine translocase subunit TatC [Candidatus Omnitrophica bacterium]|nr:twin-arginine translocase subunit TatC [Candidatus Omnitrophota bacterium]
MPGVASEHDMHPIEARDGQRGEEPRLTFIGHLEELRRRLGISLASFLIAAGISATQMERILHWLQRPVQPLVPAFAFFTPTEPFVAYTKVAVLCGFLLAMPVILSQLWAFVRPGLTPRERAYGLAFVWWGSAQFLAGGVFAYGVLLPLSLKFLLGIGAGVLEPVISIDRYLSFVTALVFWCGVVFELPVAIVLLAKVGIVTPEWLRQQRPSAILVLVIIAALVTPTTDAISLSLLAVPMLLLYELSILMSRLAHPRSSSRSQARE